jgi:hypothetical protein
MVRKQVKYKKRRETNLQFILQSRYRDWYRNFAQLPFWEENIDRQVQLYLSGVQNVGTDLSGN